MAEFQEVAKEYIRMCESFECCKWCPLNSGTSDIYVCRNNIIKNPVKYEYAIMQWAAEHPEPVYPTWWEYLRAYSVTGENIPDSAVIYKLKNWEIPADIAQKLEITPKENN